jgi:hypothetical protein
LAQACEELRVALNAAKELLEPRRTDVRLAGLASKATNEEAAAFEKALANLRQAILNVDLYASVDLRSAALYIRVAFEKTWAYTDISRI